MKYAISRAAMVACAICLLCAPMLFGQGTDLGTIRGTVTDSSGALVPNAKVVIVDLSTGSTRETVTNSQGDYQAFGIKPGNYKVSVSAAGMSTTDLTGVVVTGSDVIGANAVLRVAGQSEAVEVTTEAPTINTADQTIPTRSPAVKLLTCRATAVMFIHSSI